MRVTKIFTDFFKSEQAGGVLLIACTVLSLLLSNQWVGQSYIDFWNQKLGSHSITGWINDGLMTIYFLLIGLELEREIYRGELSNVKKASLPFFAALGGMLVPALIFIALNHNSAYSNGYGIAMATDIAFSLAILSLLGKKVPNSLRVFLTALAVIDDLGAIILIAVVYTKNLSLYELSMAFGVWIILLVLGRLRVYKLWIYLLGGFAMWYFMMGSGIHATISGVLLAFAIPFGGKGKKSLSYRLQESLHKPVAFIILPLFALANTAMLLAFSDSLFTNHFTLGILLGLVIGKPIGILLLCGLAVGLGIAVVNNKLSWSLIIGAALLAGIGFTMSIFISMLAFTDLQTINSAKLMVLIASLIAAVVGYVYLLIIFKSRKAKSEHLNVNTNI